MTTSREESRYPVLLPFLRIGQLFCSDTWHLAREVRPEEKSKGQEQWGVSEEQEQWIATRDGPFFDFAEKYLENANKDTWDLYNQLVQKTVTLAGWFGILFVALSLPLSLMKDSVVARLPDWPLSAKVLISLALLMLVLSLFGIARVLWRLKYDGDVTHWLLNRKFPNASSLRTERILELIVRIPKNQSQIAVKTRLYQGAVWAFFFAVLLEIGGIARLMAAQPGVKGTPRDAVEMACWSCTAPMEKWTPSPTLTPVPTASVTATVVPARNAGLAGSRDAGTRIPSSAADAVDDRIL